MHNNHLLKSLLTNTSASRSNSPAVCHQLTGTFGFYPRSNSAAKNSHRKHQNIHNDHQYIPLIKSILNLNVKIRQNYLFAFCKLEQLTKGDKKSQKSHQQYNESMNKKQFNQNLIIDLDQENKVSIFDEYDNIKSNQRRIQEQSTSIIVDKCSTIKKGILLLQEWILMRQTKSNVYDAQAKKEYFLAFQSIKKRSSKSKGLISLILILQKFITNRKQAGMVSLQRYQTIKMRCQIMMINLNYVINKQLNLAFASLKQYQSKIKKQVLQSSDNEKQAQCKFYYSNISYQSVIDSSRDRANQYKQNQQRQQKAKEPGQKQQYQLKRPKLIIKQKKINIAKPINLNMRPLKAQNIKIGENNFLKMNQINNEISMANLLALKPEYMVNCLPDFNDNCFIFRQNPIEEVYPAVKYEIDTCATDWKHMASQLNNMAHSNVEKCLTQRNNKSHFSSRCLLGQSHKAQHSTSKHHHQETSPLQKIDHILQKLTNMKQFKIVNTKQQIQKKKVNLNLNYKLQKVKYGSYNSSIENTPTKYLMKEKKNCIADQQRQDFKQFQKQNCRDRLITQKQKGMTPKSSCELQPDSMIKHKSTIMARNGKKKVQKCQISTAKKMKMEIQNIIIRRNKQLLSRNQSIAFK